jgi:small-conductance mechanosensitive channel
MPHLQLSPFATQWLSSAIVIILAFGLRWLGHYVINHSSEGPWEIKRQWRVRFSSALWLFTFISMAMIWSNELQTLALSIVAFSVAIVVASKEVITCFSGGLFRTSKSFKIGDRIEIKGIRGDVIDKSLMATKILEIGPGQTTHQYTGRSVVLPNSIFLTESVTNESFLGNYVLHPFIIPMRIEDDWQQAEKIILEIANGVCGPFLGPASEYLRKVQDKANLETPEIHPRVHVKVQDIKTLNLIVRVTVPAYDKGKIEQAIVKEFLKRFKYGKSQSFSEEDS